MPFNLTRLRALFQGAVHKGGSLRRKVLANKNQATRTHGAHVRRSPRLQHASRNDESPKTPTTESHRVRKPDSLQTPDHGKLGNKNSQEGCQLK